MINQRFGSLAQPARFLLLATLIAVTAGCAAKPNVFSAVDPQANLADYKTYGFLSDLATDTKRYESLESSFLKVAVAQQMDRRGYQYTADPELLVNFNINTKEKIRSRSVPSANAYYGYRDPFYGGWGTGMAYETRIDQFTEGTLTIDVVDAGQKKLIWEGSIVGKITEKDVQNLEAVIDDAVNAIFEQFPASDDVPGS
jgi:hypothetical protein